METCVGEFKSLGNQVVFIIEEDDSGGYFTHSIDGTIFTQGDTLEELKDMIKDALFCAYEEEYEFVRFI